MGWLSLHYTTHYTRCTALHYLSALRVTRGIRDLIHNVAMSVSTDRRGHKAHNKRGHEHEHEHEGGWGARSHAGVPARAAETGWAGLA